jgi:hypothetical protein
MARSFTVDDCSDRVRITVRGTTPMWIVHIVFVTVLALTPLTSGALGIGSLVVGVFACVMAVVTSAWAASDAGGGAALGALRSELEIRRVRGDALGYRGGETTTLILWDEKPLPEARYAIEATSEDVRSSPPRRIYRVFLVGGGRARQVFASDDGESVRALVHTLGDALGRSNAPVQRQPLEAAGSVGGSIGGVALFAGCLSLGALVLIAGLHDVARGVDSLAAVTLRLAFLEIVAFHGIYRGVRNDTARSYRVAAEHLVARCSGLA